MDLPPGRYDLKVRVGQATIWKRGVIVRRHRDTTLAGLGQGRLAISGKDGIGKKMVFPINVFQGDRQIQRFKSNETLDLDVGTYDFAFVRDFVYWKREVKIEEGKIVSLESPYGRLSVKVTDAESNPVATLVRLNGGRAQGTSFQSDQSADFPAGTYWVQVNNPKSGEFTAEKEVVIEAHKATSIELKLP